MGKFENTKKEKNPQKMRAFSAISIEISLVRQEGLEPTTFGSGGQRSILGTNKLVIKVSIPCMLALL
ncbi:hypothetical protein IH879_21530 [candidate division KSB1 bacterium]|nr:hypothetical protein [candidate division KSB1 bacterium]